MFVSSRKILKEKFSNVLDERREADCIFNEISVFGISSRNLFDIAKRKEIDQRNVEREKPETNEVRQAENENHDLGIAG